MLAVLEEDKFRRGALARNLAEAAAAAAAGPLCACRNVIPSVAFSSPSLGDGRPLDIRDGDTAEVAVRESTTEVGVTPVSSAASAIASTASAAVIPGAAVMTNASSAGSAKPETSMSVAAAPTSSTSRQPWPAEADPAPALPHAPENPWASSASNVSKGSDLGTSTAGESDPTAVGAAAAESEMSMPFDASGGGGGGGVVSGVGSSSRASATSPSPATAPLLLLLPALDALPTLLRLLTLPPGEGGGLLAILVVMAGYSAAGGDIGTCAQDRSGDELGGVRRWCSRGGDSGEGGTADGPSSLPLLLPLPLPLPLSSQPSSGSTTHDPWLEVGDEGAALVLKGAALVSTYQYCSGGRNTAA